MVTISPDSLLSVRSRLRTSTFSTVADTSMVSSMGAIGLGGAVWHATSVIDATSAPMIERPAVFMMISLTTDASEEPSESTHITVRALRTGRCVRARQCWVKLDLWLMCSSRMPAPTRRWSHRSWPPSRDRVSPSGGIPRSRPARNSTSRLPSSSAAPVPSWWSGPPSRSPRAGSAAKHVRQPIAASSSRRDSRRRVFRSTFGRFTPSTSTAGAMIPRAGRARSCCAPWKPPSRASGTRR